MASSYIEITENEYMIKLNKNEYDLGYIKRMLYRLMTERSQPEDEANDPISRNLNSNEFTRFDHLGDK